MKDELLLYGYTCEKCDKYFKVTDSIKFCPFCGAERDNSENKIIYDGEFWYDVEEKEILINNKNNNIK